MFRSAASATSVEQAAKKLADTSYPMVKATDWATTDVLDKDMASVPTTKEFSKAILELSVNLDPTLVKNAVQAHKKAVDAMGPDFVAPLRNHEEVTVALAKMFAAAPKDKIKAVFDATPGVQDLNAAWYAQMPQAHLDAVSAVDGQLLTPLANHEAVTVAIAKLIASAPPAKIKAVFDTVPNVQGLNFDWFSTMSVPDAVKSYQAFLETAAAVKAR